MTEQPTTTVVDTWADAEAHLAAHTGTGGRHLPALTALLDSDYHHLVLDPDTRTLWWAYDNEPLDGDGWTIEQLTPTQAERRLFDTVDSIQDRIDNPELYNSDEAAENDQDALDEYTAILALGLPAEPAAAAAGIKRRRALIARQDALWQRTYATLVRDLAGDERGGKTRAAKALGVSDMQVGRIIREDDQRRETTSMAVKAALLDR